MSTYSIAHGDVVEVLRDYQDNVFDALLCDPPYGLKFMSKAWDYDVPSVALWAECLRVLKPGAPLLAFGGSRTYHRLACGIEDAGFELRDCLMWLHGKGFPKSQNVSKALADRAGQYQVGSYTWVCYAKAAEDWAGYGSALKPAHEPIVLARKPLEETTAFNIMTHGVGGLNIDGCRIGNEKVQINTYQGGANLNYFAEKDRPGGNGIEYAKRESEGRWPANLLLDEEAAALLDAESPPTKSVKFGKGTKRNEDNIAKGVLPFPSRRTAGGYSEGAGGVSRFFYCAKVSTKEREAGCAGLPLKSAGEVTDREDGSAGLDNPRAGAGRTGGARNFHPTLKPISLTSWLARLICPPGKGAVLLVPFAGSGSEMIGALKAGWSGVLGIEREADYVTIARARLSHWCSGSEVAA